MLFIQSLSIGVKPRLFFLSEFEHVLPITCNSLFPPVVLDCFISSPSSGISSMCPGAGGAFGSFRRPCPFATRQYSVTTFRSNSPVREYQLNFAVGCERLRHNFCPWPA